VKSLLQCCDVGFSFTDRKVLRDISFSLEAGTCSALVGPNGAGKTTLLRLLSGSIAWTSGDILYKGQTLAQVSRKQRSRLIALVPQQLDVPFEFTVQQIVEQGRAPFLGILRGLLREDRLVVDRAMDLADVWGLRSRIYNELSGGERQRVKIALGLAQEPTLLLLDEPTQNMDIGRQAELINLLRALCDQGITIFASIHDLHLVHGNFDRVHLIEPAESLISGPPHAVLTPANLSRAFRCPPSSHPLLVPQKESQVTSR
jgi:iron complex transport system ATP-binding protein